MKYDPKDAVTVLPAGEYNAVLEQYEERLSKKGNEMGVLTWKIFPEGSNSTPFVTDYIVVPQFTWKLKKLAKALGREQDFKDAKFQPGDFVGSSVKLILEIQQSDGYDDKNGVETYVPLPEGESSPKFAKAGPNVDIPF